MSSLPAGFVYLEQVDNTIAQNLRYYSKQNFIGRLIPGYLENKVILTGQAALSLAKAQKYFIHEGYSLVVYDGYRPQKAVDYFVAWSMDKDDQIKKPEYYPDIDKAKVFELGYIAKKSGHSRGSTVDLTIIKLGQNLKDIELKQKTLQNGQNILFLDDGSVDMGTGFDFLSTASHHDSELVDADAIEARNYLRFVMNRYGFKEYSKEWWHYTLADEPFPDTYFDFDVK